MKKNLRKLLSLALALMMLLSILPMAVFAAEKEDEVEPANMCNHSYDVTVTYSYTYVNASKHNKTTHYEYVCLLCGYKKPSTDVVVSEPHTYRYILIGITTNDDTGTIYTYEVRCTSCGHSYIVNLPNPV